MINQPNWRWWTIALRGLVAVLFGVLAIMRPGAAFTALVLLFGVYAIIDGVLALSVASSSIARRRGWIIARGIVSIAAGVITLAWPAISAVVLLAVIAAWAIIGGVFELGTAIHMRKELEHEWLVGLEGLLSVLFGIALFISPL